MPCAKSYVQVFEFVKEISKILWLSDSLDYLIRAFTTKNVQVQDSKDEDPDQNQDSELQDLDQDQDQDFEN